MKAYLLSFVVGCLVGGIYAAVDVRREFTSHRLFKTQEPWLTARLVTARHRTT
jgi:hypothetical protein